MPSVSPLARIGLALSGLPKENVAKRYVAMNSNESKKCKDVSAKFFYNLSQFFLTLIGCSDKQILKRTIRSLVFEIRKNILAVSIPGLHIPKKQLRELKKQVHKVKINVKDLMKFHVSLNKTPANIPKDIFATIIKEAKAASAALIKNNDVPMNTFLKKLANSAPNLGFNPRLFADIQKLNPLLKLIP